MGFEAPTLIQAQAIPVVLFGRHVLVNAATGTGKTVAYLAPIIHHLQSYTRKVERTHRTFALVLGPTRELCLQVYEILQKLLHCFHWIVPGYVMGGESRSKEKARLRKGSGIARPKLVLHPRSMPVSNDNGGGSKPKGSSPFGDARPREAVLAEKGKDWKEIDDKLDSEIVKVDNVKGWRFGNGNGRASPWSNPPDERSS